MHASAPPAPGGFYLHGEHRFATEHVVGSRVNLRAHDVGLLASPIPDFTPEQHGQEWREAQKQSSQITHCHLLTRRTAEAMRGQNKSAVT